jgi:hypothetical protein
MTRRGVRFVATSSLATASAEVVPIQTGSPHSIGSRST